jgi:enoyl-CoA hydratase/carnithine racemase
MTPPDRCEQCCSTSKAALRALRLNRPDKGNAIDERMAADLAEAATQIAERSDVRAVLITGNGPNFTVGGDLGLFAGTAREQLPNRLRRMIDSYHLAIERLTSIDAPVVAAMRGGAGGGGLGLMYVADIVVATEDDNWPSRERPLCANSRRSSEFMGHSVSPFHSLTRLKDSSVRRFNARRVGAVAES